MNTFDVIIIGTGTAGQTAALDLAAEEYNVAIIEGSERPGGVCALRGCQAKKWFYEVSELVARSRHLQDMGVTAPPQVSWQQIMREKNKFTDTVPDNTVKNLKGNGVTYIAGAASFHDESTVTVNDEKYTARSFIVATGAQPTSLPFEGSSHMITSDDFLELDTLPERIAFVGGGFISFEFAHFAAHLGDSQARIHILEAAGSVLSPFDQEMVEQLVEASESAGIQIHTSVSIQSIKKKNNSYSVCFDSAESLEVDLVVNGAGRAANIDKLNLAAAGIDFSKRGITVDSTMRSSNSRVFAVGDCADTIQLARVADMEAHVAVETVIADKTGGISEGMDYSAVPAILFTYPQLGMVGKTEEELKEDNITYYKSFDKQLSWPTYRRVGL
ncbi:MAG: NAD(P)/FAD-dependent oxidoreductase, partial [Desulfocapsaceae bacterium]|nr:NAD(P)/FAD-dependent oxidoreductase [Desulfocapsaceae bacterium]